LRFAICGAHELSVKVKSRPRLDESGGIAPGKFLGDRWGLACDLLFAKETSCRLRSSRNLDYSSTEIPTLTVVSDSANKRDGLVDEARPPMRPRRRPAYYAVFYAATAALVERGLQFKSEKWG
jgi:hypothetical protein